MVITLKSQGRVEGLILGAHSALHKGINPMARMIKTHA